MFLEETETRRSLTQKLSTNEIEMKSRRCLLKLYAIATLVALWGGGGVTTCLPTCFVPIRMFP